MTLKFKVRRWYTVKYKDPYTGDIFKQGIKGYSSDEAKARLLGELDNEKILSVKKGKSSTYPDLIKKGRDKIAQ